MKVRENLKEKICLVTGANAGIGKESCVELAAMGAQVVMVARNKTKGEDALSEVIERSGNDKVTLELCDFGSFAQVHNLAERIASKYNHLDVLINNAGAFFSSYGETEDGHERQWQINHLSPFLLTHLLLPLLKAAPKARIVNVASTAHYSGKMYLKDPSAKKHKEKYKGLIAYSQSKLANVLFTYELARRLKDTSITANCLHPGVVSTDIGQKGGSSWENIGWKIMRPFMIGPKKGAETQVFLASASELDGVTGKYFQKSKEKRSSKVSHDESLAKELWSLSEQMVALS